MFKRPKPPAEPDRRMTQAEVQDRAELYASVISAVRWAADRVGLPERLVRALENLAQRQMYRALERFITENLP